MGALCCKGKNLTHDEFYQKMAASKESLKTSQLRAEREEVSSGLTAKGYTHAIGLRHLVFGFTKISNILVDEFEGQLNSGLKNHQCSSRDDGRRLLEMGWWRPFLRTRLWPRPTPDWWKPLPISWWMILNHLVKGGRLSNGAAILEPLSIKPILHFNDEGVIEVFEKVRIEKCHETAW